ncbi:MAG: response regulator [Zetaproteobacteria bacterium CG_4_9_14_3_um_filter_53_7]|nr:MAG: response regulator [Zetaproteobacteria bacterium CG_4_9_14_3_um_filter_53_7]
MPIYIVDDNRDLGEFLTCLLQDRGYTVHSFTHPAEALAHMKEQPVHPSVLITDYNLPAMNGYKLHQQMMLLEPTVKTVVISGRNISDEIGDLHFLLKPFAPDEIVELVESIRTQD